MSNEAGKEIGDFIGAMGPAIAGLSKTFTDRETQRDTHEWKVQPDGTQKWLPKDPAAGRVRLSSTATPATPAGTDDAPAHGIPRPGLTRRSGGQDPKYGGRVVLPAAKRPRPTIAFGEGNDPQGMDRPCSCTGPNCNCG